MGQLAFPWIASSQRLLPYPTWQKIGIAISYSAFATAAATNSIGIYSLPSSGIIHGIMIKPTASFTGGSITAYTIAIGDAATPNLYASAFNVLQAPGANVFQLSSDFGGESLIAATELYATATSTGANLNAATAGSVNIYALLSRVSL